MKNNTTKRKRITLTYGNEITKTLLRNSIQTKRTFKQTKKATKTDDETGLPGTTPRQPTKSVVLKRTINDDIAENVKKNSN